jgi:hypothetical protein
MIEPDLYEDFVKRDHSKKKNTTIKSSNQNDLINLDILDNNKNTNSALGKLTKKMQGFSFKNEKNKKSILLLIYLCR